MTDEQISPSPLADSSEKKEKISLTSRKKWLWLGIIIAIVNPIFSGLIIGIAFWTEPELKKEAKIVLAVAIIWGLIAIYLSRWLAGQGYLPNY
jgi:formate/nitrite transporter FocA (FNT family)